MNFITTTLPYANSTPHVGHALEFVQADFWRRYLPNSYLNIGLDEHGKKIYDTAIENGETPKDFVDKLRSKWVAFCNLYDIQYDNFYRTSDESHHIKVREIWNRLEKKGEIYLKNYSGLYCKGCEEFKTHTQIINDRCGDHPTIELEKIDEKNYFFDITKWGIINTDLVYPHTKRLELKNVIENAREISVSRKDLEWGVKTPNGDQIIYVWFDALLNYIFANPNWNENNNIQLCGPDNLRFQGHFFQAILNSLEVKQTDTLLVHGTILDKNGIKISKSLGNTIDPVEQLDKYGLIATKYYFLKGISTFENSNWNEEILVNDYNSDLCDNYGNLISRVVHLIKTKNVKINPDEEYCSDIDNQISDIHSKLKESWNISEYFKSIAKILKKSNQYINDKQPWKTNDIVCLSNLYYTINKVTELYRPLLGDKKTNSILESIKSNEKDVFFVKIK